VGVFQDLMVELRLPSGATIAMSFPNYEDSVSELKEKLLYFEEL
jgi:hypothetical protein